MDLSALENQAPSAMKKIPFSGDKIDKSFNMVLTSHKYYGVIPVIPALMGQIIKNWRCMRRCAQQTRNIIMVKNRYLLTP